MTEKLFVLFLFFFPFIITDSFGFICWRFREISVWKLKYTVHSMERLLLFLSISNPNSGNGRDGITDISEDFSVEILVCENNSSSI